jgi:hypothetical protein
MNANAETDSVLINLFGTGCTIAAGYLDNEALKKLRTYMKETNISLEEVLSDYRNLHWLEIDKVRKWQQFGTYLSASGLYDNPYSFVELRVSNKSKVKIALGDICRQRSLFPIYKKKIKGVDLSGNTTGKSMLIAMESVIGKTGTARFDVPKFYIENIDFRFTSVIINEMITYTILTEVFYAEKKLSFTKPDVLVNGFFALIT